MSTQILIKKAAKHALIKTAIEEWLRIDGKRARAAIKYIREVTSQDMNKNGSYDFEDPESAEHKESFLQFRFPADLFYILRGVIPGWGDDDADIKELVVLFPDLMPREMRNRLRGTGPNRRKIEREV
jgi:hypothetical protein